MKDRLGLVFFLFLLTACAFKPSVVSGQQSCEGLTALNLTDTTITSAVAVAAGPFKLPPLPQVSAVNSVDLPAFCRVAGTIKPTPDSDIRFEVWLPASGWNGRFLQVGNGGFAGSIPPLFLTRPLLGGYATAATDNGHQNPGTAWAIGHPEKLIDFAYRAVHLTSEKSKEVVKAYYGKGPEGAYFNGCSEGGREALMEAQLYPDDFNGIISGNPGHVWNHLFFAGIWNSRAFQAEEGSYVPLGKLALAQAAVVAACDAQDGVKDGLISDPENCHFDPAVLKCNGTEGVDCLTEAQITALKKVYDGPHNSRTGERINFGLKPGYETSMAAVSRAPGTARPPGLADFFFSGMVFEKRDWDSKTLNFDSDVALTDARVGFLNATNPDLTRFKSRGGKLIQYHGWSDPGVPPLTSVDYYERVTVKSRGLKNTQRFFRLFMAPGMFHCFGGPGPNSFGNILAPLPLQSSADNDVQKAIERWVERGIAPDKITATKYVDDDPKKGVVMTRPLCPYPQQARWTGKGSTDDAANFVCTAPKKETKGSNKRGI